jgi:hypothetical protein
MGGETVSSITERVALGAIFLNEHDPGWWRADVERAIDLETLYLGLGGRCILGQRCPFEDTGKYTAFHAFARVLSGLPLDLDDDEESGENAIDRWAAPLGFQAYTYGCAEYDELTAEWARVIRERRSTA